jgi:hypothetical protein
MASRRARPGPGTTAGVRGVHPPDARDAAAQRPPLLRSVSGSLATAARRGHPPPRRTSQDRGLCGHPGRRVGERVRETGGHSRSNSVAPCLAATRRRSSKRSRKGRPRRLRLSRARERRNELTEALQEIPALIDPCTGPLPAGADHRREHVELAVRRPARRRSTPRARWPSASGPLPRLRAARGAPRRSARSRLSVRLDGGAAR